jgi:hypothetical protein
MGLQQKQILMAYDGAGVTRLYWVVAYWELLITDRRHRVNMSRKGCKLKSIDCK